MEDVMAALPADERTVWMFWEQGADAAPPLVRLCLQSWQRLNPTWSVRMLDGQSVHRVLDEEDLGLDLRRPDLTVQTRSDVIRLALLRQAGGVWADATAFCWRPLDEWLPSALSAQLFAFRRPGPDRLLSSWFLAAHRDSVLLRAFLDRFSDVFRGRVFDRQSDPATREVLRVLRGYYSRDPQGTLFWTSPFALDYLHAYPYFILHYTFNAMVLTDPQLGRLWDAVPEIEAGPAHLLQRDQSRDAREVLAEARAAAAPVQKLSLRADLQVPYWRAVLDDLTARVDASTTPSGASPEPPRP